jgi:hypothetical protein
MGSAAGCSRACSRPLPTRGLFGPCAVRSVGNGLRAVPPGAGRRGGAPGPVLLATVRKHPRGPKKRVQKKPRASKSQIAPPPDCSKREKGPANHTCKGLEQFILSRQNLLGHAAVDVGQAVVATVVTVGQLLVIPADFSLPGAPR